MGEVNLKNVTKNFTTTENGTILNVDLSFLAAFENVHFIIVLKPNFDGENCPDFFKIQSSTLANNQFFKQFTKSHRHSEGIKDFLSFWQHSDIFKLSCNFVWLVLLRIDLSTLSLPLFLRQLVHKLDVSA